MPRHYLSQVDPIARTASCSVCGSVETIISAGKPTCKNRYYESYKKWRDKQPKLPKRERTFKSTAHVLSNINDIEKTATCSVCGSVKIYVFKHPNYTTRRCSLANIKSTSQARKNRKSANQIFIDQYKVTIGCQRCGYKESPIGLDLHHRNPGEKELKMAKVSSYSRERIYEELQKCDVLCAICHRLVHHELENT